MSHLSAERLAALADGQPDFDERAHLAICPACEREREAYRTIVCMAEADRSTPGLPLTRWDAIAAELGREGVLSVRAPTRGEAAHGAAAIRSLDDARGRVARWQMQIAAGLLLLAGGAMAGRVSAGARPLPAPADEVASARASSPASTDSMAFPSVEAARVEQSRAEARYQQAAAYLAQFDTTGADGNPVAYRSRLAALDAVISTTREAMREAPHDPVINGYYLTTLGQREATLRQLNTALPASLRLNSF